jgi:hypothetical protein
MHHFHTNSSVTINAATQDTGVIVGKIYRASIEGDSADISSISIECSFTKQADDTPVYHTSYRVSLADLNTFADTVTLDSTKVADEFQELCTRYAMSQVEAEGMWGLTGADWTIEQH